MSPNVAKSVVIWATKWVKDIHIRSKCILDPDMERVRELILSMASVAFLHPSAVYDADTPIFPADVSAAAEISGGVCVSLRSLLPEHESVNSSSPNRGRFLEIVRKRPASVMAWSVPAYQMSETLRVPYPSMRSKTMNSTVIVVGNLVHPKISVPCTYVIDVEQSGLSDIVGGGMKNSSRATITYLASCESKIMPIGPMGLYYPSPTVQGIDDGSTVIMLNGSKCVDDTCIGMVRFAEYNGMCVPLVCGCAVINRVRFERGHIPLVYMPTNAVSVKFSDAEPGVVVVFENGRICGRIDVRKKEKHGSVWWVHLVNA
jgi:hypothetical protein